MVDNDELGESGRHSVESEQPTVTLSGEWGLS